MAPPLCVCGCLQGLTNFDGILRESDGIILGRGDLGIDLAPEKVRHPAHMLRRCRTQASSPSLRAVGCLWVLCSGEESSSHSRAHAQNCAHPQDRAFVVLWASSHPRALRRRSACPGTSNLPINEPRAFSPCASLRAHTGIPER